MGIGSIANVSLEAVIRSGRTDVAPVTMTRVEDPANAGDDSYSSSEGGPAEGAADGGANGELDDQPEGGGEEAAGETAGETGTGRQLSLFA